jgi:glyoxylase-like metal-dependent hydrolase (beta-lactamase superfamily II)
LTENCPLVQIIPGLYLIAGENDGRFPYAHSFFVDGSIRALVDTGAGIARLEWMRERFHIDMVISSHSHPDHTAGNWLFQGLPLYAPEQATNSFGRLHLLSHRFVERGPLGRIWRRFVQNSMQFRDALCTHTFDHNSVFDFGPIVLIAIHTPGHVVDHMCFFEPKHGILLSSDIDLTSFGPWYGHRESSIPDFKDSIRRVMDLKPRIIVSSHKGLIRHDIQDHLVRYLAKFDERKLLIKELIAAGYSVPEIVESSPIYGQYPYAATLLKYWEEQMIRKHIEELGW